jgi:hypothetical protein
MTHTNLHIPREDRVRLALEHTRLRAELSFWQKQAEHLQSELENIPLAIEKYGHIDISHEDGKLTLIAKPVEPSDV